MRLFGMAMTLEPLRRAGSRNGLIAVAKRVVTHRCMDCTKNSRNEARGKKEEMEVSG